MFTQVVTLEGSLNLSAIAETKPAFNTHAFSACSCYSVYNILLGYVIMTYFYHNSCVVSFEFRSVLKYFMSVHKDSVSWEY